MATIIPEGDRLRQAVRFISDCIIEKGDVPVSVLIERASLKFNLSPKEEDYLRAFYRDKNKE